MVQSRTRKCSAEKGAKTPSKPDHSAKAQKEWVFLTKDEALEKSLQDEDSRPTVCKLRHPRKDGGVLYLVSADCQKYYELNCFDEKFHSWFIGDKVHSGNQIFIATPIDPLFLILPYMINAGKENRFTPLEQMVTDEDFPECEKLLRFSDFTQIKMVADFKDIDEDLQVYRYSKDKTLKWLQAKTAVLAQDLEKKDICVSAKGSKSSMFVRSKNATDSKDSYMRYACGMISDYIASSLEKDLTSYLGIPEEPVAVKKEVKEEPENEPPKKKARLSTDLTTPTDDYSSGVDLKKGKAKNVKLTSAQKKLQQTDKTGMKSLSSFFSPKPKK